MYNNYSLVTQRTDSRNVVTTYTYDPSLNRISQISYNTAGTTAQATSNVNYTYGTNPATYSNGSVITLTDGTGSESYSYDLLGRKTQVQKVMNNVTYTTGFSFNLAGEVVTITYPSGRVLRTAFDSIGRLQSVQNNSTSANYFSSITYNAAHQTTGFAYGNGITATYGYSAQRFQPSAISYVQGTGTIFGLAYTYTQNGGNNGQVTGITDSADSGRSVAYTFDSLNRLTAAVTTGSANYPGWGLSWTYDRYGNRAAQTVTAGSGYSGTVTVDPTTNRVTAIGASGVSYDASGNLTQDDLYKYVYDAENRLVQLNQLNGSNIATYSYDGNSLQVVKVVGTSRTYFVYQGSDLLSEFTDTSTTTYTSGTTPQPAPADTSSLILYQHPDHLTTRVTTDNHAYTASWQGHYPFGDPWYDSGTTPPSVPRKFTSYRRDSEGSLAMLNYATFREHSGRMGRFLSTDPDQSRIRGQGLNRYSYVGGDPINRADPSGRQWDDGDPSDYGFCRLWRVLPGWTTLNIWFQFGVLVGEGEAPLDPVCLEPGTPPAKPKPSRPCDVRITVPWTSTDVRCSLTSSMEARMTIVGSDFKSGGRAIVLKGWVTTSASGSRNFVDLDGTPNLIGTDYGGLPAKWSQKVNVAGPGWFTWTVRYKCDNHMAEEPLTQTVRFTCR